MSEEHENIECETCKAMIEGKDKDFNQLKYASWVLNDLYKMADKAHPWLKEWIDQRFAEYVAKSTWDTVTEDLPLLKAKADDWKAIWDMED